MADSSSAEAAGRGLGQQQLIFEGGVALITGAGGGIGLAVALFVGRGSSGWRAS